MKKKVIIIIAAALLLTGGILWAVLSASGTLVLDGTGESYPFTGKKKGQNLVVNLEKDVPKGYKWTVSDSGSGIYKVSLSGSRAVIKPVSGGTDTVSFSLDKEGGIMPERIFTIGITVMTNTDKSLAMAGYSCDESISTVSDTDAGIQYAFMTLNDGSLSLVTDLTEENCRVISEDDSFFTLVINQLAEGLTLRFTPSQAGSTVVYVCNTETGKAIYMELSADEDGTASVSSHQVTDYTVEEEEE